MGSVWRGDHGFWCVVADGAWVGEFRHREDALRFFRIVKGSECDGV